VDSSYKEIPTAAIKQDVQLSQYPQQAAAPSAAPTAAMNSPSTGRGTIQQGIQTATAKSPR